MKAIIPAAGYATRLYPLTENQPKALLDIQGKPIITHIIRKIEELGVVDGIYVISNDKFSAPNITVATVPCAIKSHSYYLSFNIIK